MDGDASTAPAPAEGRPPAVLQVLPSLVSGGVERGTVELAEALTRAGWQAYVASAGGPVKDERGQGRINAWLDQAVKLGPSGS